MAMRIVSRYLVAALLCFVLPLQASAALVRTVMMMPLASPAQEAATELAAPQSTVQLAHAIGAPHQHGAHAHHENLPRQKAGKDGKNGKAAPASHKSKHAKGDCPTCAKCCLLAAAPPPMPSPASSLPVSRVAFATASIFIPSFLPDGPERPPRFSLAA